MVDGHVALMVIGMSQQSPFEGSKQFHSDTGLEETRIVTITRELCGLVSK